ncbi:TetR/AcrR family transcriptional regulator [Mycobacterium sp. ML4]
MPQNRRAIPREQRVEAVIGAARERFQAQGYKGTSIAEIARDVGVNSGSVHWYFPSKDDLFAAVLRRIAEESKSAVDAALASGATELEALVDFLTSAEKYRGIHIDAHDRLTESPTVAAAHDELHQWLDALLLDVVRPQLDPDQDVLLIADTAHIVFEGIFGSSIPRDRPFEDIVAFLVNMLVTAAPHVGRRLHSTD